MFVRWPRAVALLSTIIGIAALANPAVGCPVAPGDKVVLASIGLDPDVFVWDSAARLIAYSQGDYNTETVLKHTMLAHPGTSALTIDCRLAPVTPKPGRSEMNIVGVKLTSGPNRGRFGWVVAEDVRHPDGKPVTISTP